MGANQKIDAKTQRHIRALVIMQADQLAGRPWRPLREITRALKRGEIT